MKHTISNADVLLQEHTTLLATAKSLVLNNPKEARKIAKNIFNISVKNSQKELQWQALTIIVRTFVVHRVISRQSQYWINLAKKEVSHITTANAPELLLQFANYYMIADNLPEAELYYERAFQKFTDISSNVPVQAYLNRAHMYMEFEQYEKGWRLLCTAEAILQQELIANPAMPISPHIHDMAIYTITLTAAYFLFVEDFHAAEYYIRKGINECTTPQLLARKGYFYGMLLNILIRNIEFEEAEHYITEIYNIFLQTKHSLLAVDVYLGYAYLRKKQGKFSEALAYGKKAYRIVRKTKEKFRHLHVVQVIAEILVEMGKTPEAEQLLMPYIALPYSSKMRRFMLRSLYIRAQIAIAKGDTVTASALLQEYIEGVKKPGFALLRNKLHVIRQRELGTFGHDELLAQHGFTTPSPTPDSSRKEFPPSAPTAFKQFDVMTSNEYLNAIRSTLVDLLHNADTLNHKSIKAKIKSVQQLIESNYNEQETLFAVEREIQHVHKDFIEKLSLQYPVLSHTEIRVCLLLRLNLNTHQIAAMMNISPATVFTHRKNIRKKIGLPRTTNLSVLLMQLSGLQVEG